MNTNPSTGFCLLSRLAALFLATVLAFSPLVRAASGPDNIDAGDPSVGCTYDSNIFSALDITSYTNYLMASTGWSDAAVWQTGRFYLSGFSWVEYGVEGGTHWTSYQEVFDINVSLDADDTSFGDTMYGTSMGGSAQTVATSDSYSGASEDTADVSAIYSW